MKRLRLYDLRVGRLPRVIGKNARDISSIANAVNTAQQRLLYAPEAGDESWWGTWSEVLFNVTRDNPYVTLPREMARLEMVTMCNNPVSLNNQFYEYLRFGNGRMPKTCANDFGVPEVLERNNSPTFTDMTNAPQLIRFYITDNADAAGKRVLLQGLDANGNTIYSQDGLNQVQGVFVNLQSTFVTCPIPVSSITGIQKDITTGIVRVYQVDPTTGDEVLISTMQPGEETASYRRYYLNSLPCGCCQSPSSGTNVVQLRAIVKMELIPVRVDTDYCLIQNEEAIIAEAQSARYSEVDTGEAKAMARERHKAAINLLNGELSHYVGRENVAVNMALFGTARLSKRKIGNML